MASGKKAKKKVLQGKVVSDRMDKTVMVLVERTVRDPKYKKYIRKRKKFMAHDEKNECHIGDRVEIVESRPLSRHKRFQVSRILARAEIVAEVVPQRAGALEVAPDDTK